MLFEFYITLNACIIHNAIGGFFKNIFTAYELCWYRTRTANMKDSGNFLMGIFSYMQVFILHSYIIFVASTPAALVENNFICVEKFQMKLKNVHFCREIQFFGVKLCFLCRDKCVYPSFLVSSPYLLRSISTKDNS